MEEAGISKWRGTTRVTGMFSAVLLAIFAFWGGWLRRWMSDDGLIVLRTVRNILAGNGPVFNAGERVETNTSTLWQYVIAFFGWLLPDAKLEMIAMWCALLCTTAALGIAAWATTKLWGRRSVVLLPFGGLIYLALPPARDFATSGLEWGLSLLWIAVLWLLLVQWATTSDHAGRASWLGFWAGLSWLVRPELALYGALIILLVLCTQKTWRSFLKMMVVSALVPVSYELFRMGYYGLLVPHTAVAKSASDSEWEQGWTYFTDLTSPYGMWMPALLVLGVAVLLHLQYKRRKAMPAAHARVLVEETAAAETAEQAETVHQQAAGIEPSVSTLQKVRNALQTPTTAILLVELAAVLHVLYVIRVGGDFMHGRMLLLPLFTLLLPVTVIPVWSLQGAAAAEPAQTSSTTAGPGWGQFVGVALWGGTALWAGLVAAGVNGYDWQPPKGNEQLTIVDEREFWTLHTQRELGDPPLLAEDFLEVPNIGDYTEKIALGQEQNAAILLSIAVSEEEHTFSWLPVERGFAGEDLEQLPLTVSMVNLGMTGMNAPLDVRVLDSVGLSNPLAARQPRIENGRVGHDKFLPTEWQIADSGMNLGIQLPWLNQQMAIDARHALYDEEIVELFETYRAPLTFQRVLSNIKFSLTLGRTLEISADPTDYFDTPHVDPQVYPIAWPVEAKLDEPR